MHHYETIVLSRDCDARLIPSGDEVTLREGTTVHITQSLGGSFTLNVHGNLVRVDGIDADALGKAPIDNTAHIDVEVREDGLADEKAIWELLKTCYDPEIPVDIVNLGLIYDLQINNPSEEGSDVVVVMTLTAPGCGMGPVLTADIEQKIKLLPNVNTVAVQLVFDPPWNQDMLSDEAKLKLGML